MNTSIIAVGTELLFGQTVNTNAAYLSENLNHLGTDGYGSGNCYRRSGSHPG